MSGLVLIPLPGNEAMAEKLAALLDGELRLPEMRNFPDGETYLRLNVDLHGRHAALVCTLDRPDAKFLPFSFAARTASELGAASVGLIAPYLAYMRQDRRFQPGEALSSHLFAALLSPQIDWLVTVDPHLHRIHSLESIYPVPNRVLHASAAIARWIALNVDKPVLIGRDNESVQWVGEVARATGALVVVLDKTRRADLPKADLAPYKDCTPVLVDDIISTAHTMIETLGELDAAGMKPAVCIGVHAIFANDAYEQLRAASPARIVTTDTIAHESNAIGIAPLLAGAIKDVMV
ncbi:MAG TPA: ribose-phosphate diphosphokinase [Rhizomicrobium sp.]|nr:ribose-phosphate diphosphokinase [Rhizomicrobium sp.]